MCHALCARESEIAGPILVGKCEYRSSDDFSALDWGAPMSVQMPHWKADTCATDRSLSLALEASVQSHLDHLFLQSLNILLSVWGGDGLSSGTPVANLEVHHRLHRDYTKGSPKPHSWFNMDTFRLVSSI